MKANELMIDDWVLWKGKPVQVASVSGVKYSFGKIDVTLSHCNDEKLLETHDIKSIQPIPLTPEILEKNGFDINGIPENMEPVEDRDWCDDTYVWSRQETPDERMFVSVYMDDPSNFFVEISCQYCHADGIHVKYLHELQHCFSICGIYKKIVP